MYSTKENMKREQPVVPPKGPPTEANTVPFGPPRVAPGVRDPAAVRYAEQVAARRGPPRYSTPVAGGPGPRIPRLDAPAESGLTMADNANMHLAAAEGPPRPSGPAPRGGMFQEPAPASAPAPPNVVRPGPAMGLLPVDILPEEARQDPAFRDGQGAMYASSQPELARKYGVIRNGQRIAPQSLGRPNKGLSAETQAGLKAINDMQATRATAEGEDARIEREAAGGPAGAAGRLGNAPADGPQSDPQVTQKNIVEAAKKLDDFDFNTFREMMMKDIINNEDQRDIIEKRCPPLDITDLIMKGFVTQRVPVIPGKFEPEFQSMTGGEDLAIKRLIMLESKGVEVSERYLLDKFSLMAVTIGLRSINGNPMPSHHDNEGKLDEDAFWKKFEKVIQYPFHMLASIGVNYFWFDVRVRKLFVAEKLGNG